MTTAVDSNILFDILIPNAAQLSFSRQALDDAGDRGALIISEPAYAELSGFFKNALDLDQFLKDIGVRLVKSSTQVLRRAGEAWRAYASGRSSGLTCSACGKSHRIMCSRCGLELRTRQHLLADFMIGAHAELNAGNLITRDRGFYQTYFPELQVEQPGTASG